MTSEFRPSFDPLLYGYLRDKKRIRTAASFAFRQAETAVSSQGKKTLFGFGADKGPKATNLFIASIAEFLDNADSEGLFDYFWRPNHAYMALDILFSPETSWIIRPKKSVAYAAFQEIWPAKYETPLAFIAKRAVPACGRVFTAAEYQYYLECELSLANGGTVVL